MEFTLTRKLKLTIVSDNEELRQQQYKFIRDSQYAQYKALNIAYSTLLSAFLKSGDLKNEEFKSTYKSLSVRKLDLNFGTGIDTPSIVIKKVKQDFNSDIKNGLAKGERGGRNYKRSNPLLSHGRDLRFYYDDEDVLIHWVHHITFKVIIGREDKDFEELKRFLHQCIRNSYRIRQSEFYFKNKELMLNLKVSFNKEINYQPIKNRVLGIDLGMHYPAYCVISDDLEVHTSFGEYSDFVRIKLQFRARKQRLEKSIAYANGGHGRKDKCKALKSLKDKERRWTRNYNHQLSKRIINYAVKHNCESIYLEDLVSKTMDKKIVSLWTYYELQLMISYKANLVGINVYKVNSQYTSQKCSVCGYINKENRKKQETFKCVNCGFTTNADYNASTNLSRSKPIKKFDGEKFINI